MQNSSIYLSSRTEEGDNEHVFSKRQYKKTKRRRIRHIRQIQKAAAKTAARECFCPM